MAARYDPESAKQYQRGDEFKGSQQPVSGGMDLRQGHQQQDQQDMDPDSARQSKTTTGVLAARNDPESERRYEEAHQREMSPASDPNRAERRGEDEQHQQDHQHHEGVGSARNDPESQRRYDEAHQREMSPASDPNRAERGEASGPGGGSNRRGGGTTGNSAEDTAKKFNENENVAYGMSVFLITLASLIVFATAADRCDNDECDDGRSGYTLAASLVSFLVGLGYLFIRYFARIYPSDKIHLGLSILFVVIWATVAGVATSVEGPFAATGNGYFATWLALFASVLYFAHAYVRSFGTPGPAHTKLHHHALTFLVAASVIQLCVAIDSCNEGDCSDREIFAMTVGAISIVICIIQISIGHWGTHSLATISGRIWAIILVILWAFAAAFSTSVEGPFFETCNSANGYFATWIAFIAASIYAFRIFVMHRPVEEA